MSRIVLTKTSAPSTPAANKSALYIDTADRKLKQIDDNGVISTLNNDGLQDRSILTNGGMMVQQRVAVASTAIPSVSTTTRAGRVADRWAVTTGNATTTSWAKTDTAAANAQVRDETNTVDCSATTAVGTTDAQIGITYTGNAATVAEGLMGVHITADAEIVA